MSKQLSSRDYETLSAYLDGELSQKDMQRVEMRLKASPELRSGLDELKYTQRILNKVPKRRAPRNFMIKPSMLPQKRRLSPAYPMLRLASALASILLVVAFASDLFLSMGLSKAVSRLNAPAVQAETPQLDLSQPAQATSNPLIYAPKAPAPQATQPAAESQALPNDTLAVQENAVQDTATPEPSTTPVPVGGGCDGACGPTAQAPMTVMGILPTPTGTIVGLGAGPAPDETEMAIAAQTNAPAGMGEGPATPTATPEAGGFHYYDTVTPTEEIQPGLTARSLEMTPTEENPAASAAIAQGTAPTQAINLTSEQKSGSPSALRLAEIILALTALGTGTAAIILRLRSNP